MKKTGGIAFALGAAGLAAGIVAEHAAVVRRRSQDREQDEEFGLRRGVRGRHIRLDDGARLYVEESGPRSRRGVVFVHGSTLRMDMWHYQMSAFGDRRLIFYDLRGHGLSQPKGRADFTVAQLARDLGAVIEDAGLDEVVIVGHSFGGMIGQQLCLDRPDLQGSIVKGIVLMNSTYGPAVETLIGGAAIARLERTTRRPFDVLADHAHRLERLRSLIRPSDMMFWGVAFGAFAPDASARQIDFTFDMMTDTPTDVIFDLVKSYRDFDARGRLDQITVPALVVGGVHDRLTLPEASEYLAEHLTKAELHILEDAGHMSMMECHEEVNELLGRFFDDVLGPARRRGSN